MQPFLAYLCSPAAVDRWFLWKWGWLHDWKDLTYSWGALSGIVLGRNIWYRLENKVCARLRSVWRNRARRYHQATTAFFHECVNGCIFSNMPITSNYLIIHSKHARRADKNVNYFSTKCGSGSSPSVWRTFKIECRQLWYRSNSDICYPWFQKKLEMTIAAMSRKARARNTMHTCHMLKFHAEISLELSPCSF